MQTFEMEHQTGCSAKSCKEFGNPQDLLKILSHEALMDGSSLSVLRGEINPSVYNLTCTDLNAKTSTTLLEINIMYKNKYYICTYILHIQHINATL